MPFYGRCETNKPKTKTVLWLVWLYLAYICLCVIFLCMHTHNFLQTRTRASVHIVHQNVCVTFVVSNSIHLNAHVQCRSRPKYNHCMVTTIWFFGLTTARIPIISFLSHSQKGSLKINRFFSAAKN